MHKYKPIVTPRENRKKNLRKISDGELATILELHKQWFDSRGREGTRADLSRVDLSRRNLSNVLLQRANLSGANLEGAILRGANLFRANLSGAILNDVQLQDAFLARVNLTAAHMRRADLSHEKLCLGEAEFADTDMTGATLINRDFHGSNLQGAIFENSIIAGCDFEQADAEGANFAGAKLQECNFRGTNLAGADLRGTKNLRLDSTYIRGARFAIRANDPWSVLRRNYTGTMLMFHLLLVAFFFIPYAIKATGLVALKHAQDVIGRPSDNSIVDSRNQSLPVFEILADVTQKLRQIAAGPPQAEGKRTAQEVLRESSQRIEQTATTLRGRAVVGIEALHEVAQELRRVEASLPHIGEERKAQEALLGLAQRIERTTQALRDKTTSGATMVDNLLERLKRLTPCLSEKCRKVPVLKILLDVDSGFWQGLIAFALVIYAFCRWQLTRYIAPLRDEEERSGYSPPYKVKGEWSLIWPGWKEMMSSSDSREASWKEFRKWASARRKVYGWLIVTHRVTQVLFWVAVGSGVWNTFGWLSMEVFLPDKS